MRTHWTHSQRKLAGSETPKEVAKTRSKAGGNEDAHCRIIPVVGTGTPTQELESKRENKCGFGRCHTEKIQTEQATKTEQATTNRIPESSTNVNRSRDQNKTTQKKRESQSKVLTKFQTKEASSKPGR